MTAATALRLAIAAIARFARAADPVVRRGLSLGARASVRGLQALGRGTRALGRGALRQRAAISAVSQRFAWWAALALLVMGGRPILGLEALPTRGIALAPFVVGLLLCAAVRLWARSAGLRVGALALGALHGAALVLVWTAFAG